MVHGGQEFVWGAPVVAGDEITTTATVKDVSERDGIGFYVFETVSRNQDGDTRVHRHLDEHREGGLMELGRRRPRAARSLPTST